MDGRILAVYMFSLDDRMSHLLLPSPENTHAAKLEHVASESHLARDQQDPTKSAPQLPFTYNLTDYPYSSIHRLVSSIRSHSR